MAYYGLLWAWYNCYTRKSGFADEQTADSGPPPMADDDEDNITSSRALHVNSVHL